MIAKRSMCLLAVLRPGGVRRMRRQEGDGGSNRDGCPIEEPMEKPVEKPDAPVKDMSPIAVSDAFFAFDSVTT